MACASLLLLAVALPAAGQDGSERPVRSSDSNGSFWFKSQTWDYFGGTKKLGYSFDIIVRRQAGFEDNNILRHRLRESFRPWFVWLIDPLNKLSIAPLSYHYDGGVRAIEATRDGVFRPELRSTIELDSATFLHERVMLNSRVRFELRHYFPFSDDYRFLIRLRLRPRLRVSLNNKNYYDTGVLYAFGYSELALHTGSIEDVPNVFNQSRNFIGGGYRFKKYMRFDAGYIYQFNSRASGTEYMVNHGLMTYLQIDYLSATLKDFSTGIRERRVRRQVGDDDLEIDDAILRATSRSEVDDPADQATSQPTSETQSEASGDSEAASEVEPATQDFDVAPRRRPWWRLGGARPADGASDEGGAGAAPDTDRADEPGPRGLWGRLRALLRRSPSDSEPSDVDPTQDPDADDAAVPQTED